MFVAFSLRTGQSAITGDYLGQQLHLATEFKIELTVMKAYQAHRLQPTRKTIPVPAIMTNLQITELKCLISITIDNNEDDRFCTLLFQPHESIKVPLHTNFFTQMLTLLDTY